MFDSIEDIINNIDRYVEDRRNDEQCDWGYPEEELASEVIDLRGYSEAHKAQVIIFHVGSGPDIPTRMRVEFDNGKTVTCDHCWYYTEDAKEESSQKWPDIEWADKNDTVAKLVYLKEQKIHQKTYLNKDKANAAYIALKKSGLPCFAFALEDYTWFMKANGNVSVKWVKVPENKWPAEIKKSVKSALHDDDEYLGCSHYYWREQDMFMFKHTYLDSESGLKIIDYSLLDRKGGAIGWTEIK